MIDSDRPEDYPHAKTIIDALTDADRLGECLTWDLARRDVEAAQCRLQLLRAAIKRAEAAICSIVDEETESIGPDPRD
jgi:hypothetical protein